MTNITYTTQTAPNTGIAAGHNKLQSHAQSPLRKNTGVGFLQTWNGRLNLLWFHYIFSFRDWYLSCWWGASLSLSCPYSYPLEETGPEENLQVQRDDRTQCQCNQKFYFLKNNIRRKNVSLLLLKVLPPCWVPAASPCSHILSVLVSSCSSGFFFWHSDDVFAYLLSKISADFFFPKFVAMASNRQWYTTCWEVPVWVRQPFVCHHWTLQVWMLDPGRTY